MQRNKFLGRFKGLFEKILTIINRRRAKAKYVKLSLYIIKRLSNDDGDKNSNKATNTLYFLSKTSNIFTNTRKKKVFNKEKIIIGKYKVIHVEGLQIALRENPVIS